MRGHIEKRGKKNGSYSIAISLGKDPTTNKYKQQWVSVKGTKKDAEKRLSEILTQLDNGTFIKPDRATLAEFLERWLNDYKPNLSPRGYERYRDIINRHLIPDLGSIVLCRLKPENIQKHYTACQDKGLSSGTVRYHHAVLHVALKTAVKWGLLARNPADAVGPPKTRHAEMKTWGEDEINIFLEASRVSRYYAVFYTALFTGMRRCELLGLKWGDVDFIMSQIYVNRGLHHLKDGSYVFTEPKSAKSRRTIALPPSAFLMLKEHKEKQSLEWSMMGKTLTENNLVFCTPSGEPFRPNTITRAWETTASKCGLTVIRLHDARHTHASIMLKQGIHPKIVQERLGHSSIQITLDTYSHVAPGLQQAAADGFDKMIFPKREKEAIKNDY